MSKNQLFLALVLVGAMAFVSHLVPSSPQDISWVRAILVLAATFLLPLWLNQQLGRPVFTVLAGGWALGLSYCWGPGAIPGILASLWLLCTLWLLYVFLLQEQKSGADSTSWCGRAAFLFLPIGAAWALADRLGWQPMGFQSTIVLLTAVHFHYAGFLLLSLTDQLLRPQAEPWHRWLDMSLIAGVPLVALGITLTEWGGPIWVETLAATVMALGGLGASLLFARVGWRQRSIGQGISMMLGSLCLGIGMLLAIAYGWRPFLILDWLDIPWMYAVHGSLNCLGITFLLLGSRTYFIPKGTGSSY